MTILVFVYGSLKKGFGNHCFLSSKAKFIRDDKLQGAFLINLGAFPGMLPGDGIVKGEVYQVTPPILQRLDRLEGHPNFYERRVVTLESGLKAWVYYLADKFASELPDKQFKKVENGDWQ